MIYQNAPAFGFDTFGLDSKPARQAKPYQSAPQMNFVQETNGGRRIFASPLLHRELITHHARL